MRKLMYRVFKTHDYNYLYDGNRNDILPISDDDYLALKSNTENDVHEKYQNMGYCQATNVKKIEHPLTPGLQQVLSTELYYMVLQVTQNCNLRCSYCPYSGTYKDRRHTNKRMSFKTAKKAVDFYINHSKNTEDIALGFYGGEPLLEFELIKKIILYIEKKYPKKRTSFSITTNGTLLSEDIVEFMSRNNFNLTISLDGPQLLHNKNRSFLNDKGSFDNIVNNLVNIKNKFPQYFKKININSVHNPEDDIGLIYDFFENNELFEFLNINIIPMSTDYIDDYPLYSEDCIDTLNKAESNFFNVNIGKIQKNTLYKIHQRNKLISIYDTQKKITSKTHLPEISHPGGPCVPGRDRLFVNVDGKLLPCERLSENSETVYIGNIYDGYNYENIINILNVAKVTEEECKNCWAFRHCQLCIASSDDLKENSRKMRLKQCNTVKDNIINSFTDYCFLKENNFNFYKRGVDLN